MKFGLSSIKDSVSKHDFISANGVNRDMLAMMSSAQQGSYNVRPGDSLWAIAQDLGVKSAELLSANGLNQWSVIHPGQTISVPGMGQRSNGSAEVNSYRVQPGDSLWSIAQDRGVSFDLQAAILKQVVSFTPA